MNYERQSATIYTAGPWHQRIWVIYADALCSCGLAVCKGIRRFRIRRRAFYSLREKMYTRRQKTPAGPAASALDTGKRVKSRSGSLSRTEPPSRIHFFNGLCAGRRHTRFSFQKKTVPISLSCSSPARDCIYRPANSTNRLCAGAGCLRGRSP